MSAVNSTTTNTTTTTTTTPPARLPDYNEYLTFSSNDEAEKFAILKDRCSEAGLLDRPETLGQKESRAGIYDDVTLLRFLRARKLDVEGAYTQFKDAVAVRRAVGMEDMYDNIDIDEFEETRQLYPYWSGRRSKEGLPLCIWDCSYLTSARMATYRAPLKPPLSLSSTKNENNDVDAKVPPETVRALAVHDSLTRLALPLCSAVQTRPHADLPISSCLYIGDLSSFGLTQAWTLKAYIPHITSLLAAHYPEMLDEVFIVNAPGFFPRVWKWIEGWFDPVTASKLRFLGKEEMGILRERIWEGDLPVRYGGTWEWEHGMGMSLDKEVERRLEWVGERKELPEGPLKWVREDGRDVIVAVGTKKGVRREEIIARLKT
ncbi:CRAL/TRIO domain-containing protein [Pseudovirgaria hyperparasitica]|uniref:CRAL/TRIO domain-containing protein n=1 Tax=Pseudovirgaria hyperparasitica TaxID=470096 RepID=A0A6A6VXR7_9PEZI|nr:CRAL/TRIO domain-containing protein [Pseudovirgaria hyperparasitica]KAF2754596.1 CRAL/TRIO domain-containing protein [Pseudovirgaria hyperparasitica]